ncbi:MAG TPA: hypothetical protein PKL08_18075 [Thermoanaerobaculaceae bacterium]|nr:hypothetical protein [Thermoanaerobaculaceae bacterium]
MAYYLDIFDRQLSLDDIYYKYSIPFLQNLALGRSKWLEKREADRKRALEAAEAAARKG